MVWRPAMAETESASAPDEAAAMLDDVELKPMEDAVKSATRIMGDLRHFDWPVSIIGLEQASETAILMYGVPAVEQLLERGVSANHVLCAACHAPNRGDAVELALKAAESDVNKICRGYFDEDPPLVIIGRRSGERILDLLLEAGNNYMMVDCMMCVLYRRRSRCTER